MTARPPKLILASRSPRRRELLAAAGYEFTVLPSEHVEECFICSRESPAEYVARLAYEKAAEVAQRTADRRALSLAATRWPSAWARCSASRTTRAQARRMLERLSGREHRVLSGLCVWPIPGGPPAGARRGHVAARWTPSARVQLDEYLASGQWEGKAGAFGYQDGLDWVHILEGSESNVVGLPMELLAEMLQAL